jgi:hypothetical protein
MEKEKVRVIATLFPGGKMELFEFEDENFKSFPLGRSGDYGSGHRRRSSCWNVIVNDHVVANAEMIQTYNNNLNLIQQLQRENQALRKSLKAASQSGEGKPNWDLPGGRWILNQLNNRSDVPDWVANMPKSGTVRLGPELPGDNLILSARDSGKDESLKRSLERFNIPSLRTESTKWDGQPQSDVNVADSFVIKFDNAGKPYYLADWEGDPGRTQSILNARKFTDPVEAKNVGRNVIAAYPDRYSGNYNAFKVVPAKSEFRNLKKTDEIE